MKKDSKMSFSGFSWLGETLIRIGLFFVAIFYTIFSIFKKPVQDISSNVYSRFVKYVGWAIFVGVMAYLYSVLNK
jgi:hypothetical protein